MNVKLHALAAKKVAAKFNEIIKSEQNCISYLKFNRAGNMIQLKIKCSIPVFWLFNKLIKLILWLNLSGN